MDIDHPAAAPHTAAGIGPAAVEEEEEHHSAAYSDKSEPAAFAAPAARLSFHQTEDLDS
jgi:hypothetical protein